MIRLDEIRENKVINNGNAGEVKGVTLEVMRKTEEHNKYFPDFKLIFSEENGANIDIGLYYFQDKDYETQKERNSRRNRYLFRLMHIVKAVKGNDFSPTQEFKSMEEAVDFCINTIEENSSGKLFDIFITFGTDKYPSKKGFLEVRYNTPFIKNSEVSTPSLVPEHGDILDKENLISLQKKDNSDDDIITKE